MGIESNYYKDLGSENISLEAVRERNQKILEKAREQIVLLKPAVIGLCNRIIEEKPDLVVFLDRGARLIASPVLKYLASKNISMPKILFYNDHELKHQYLSKGDISEVVSKDFLPYKGKKVIFVDETFSTGKGASALESAMRLSGVDGYYTALTVDENPIDMGEYQDGSLVTDSEIKDALSRLNKEGRISVYDESVGTLFTKEAAKLYVHESGDGQTVPRYEAIEPDDLATVYDYSKKKGSMPHSRAYEKPPEGIDWKEYDKEVRKLNFQTLEELRSILDAAINEG